MKKEMLKKIGMPSKRPEEMEMEEDLAFEDLDGEAFADDLEGEPEMEDDFETEAPALDDLSDDELLAEIMKRGLTIPEEDMSDPEEIEEIEEDELA